MAAVWRCAVVGSALFVFAPAASGQWEGGSPDHGGSWSGYQRKSNFADPWQSNWKRDWNRDHFRATGPNITSSTFQRPYPYHLDYYKMRYGGSYAPYFGNLYGPPTFVGTPFWGFGGYGTFNPYLGNGFDGFNGGYNGYPPGGVGYPANYPGYPDAPCVGPNCPDVVGYPGGPLSDGEVVGEAAPVAEP